MSPSFLNNKKDLFYDQVVSYALHYASEEVHALEIHYFFQELQTSFFRAYPQRHGIFPLACGILWPFSVRN